MEVCDVAGLVERLDRRWSGEGNFCFWVRSWWSCEVEVSVSLDCLFSILWWSMPAHHVKVNPLGEARELVSLFQTIIASNSYNQNSMRSDLNGNQSVAFTNVTWVLCATAMIHRANNRVTLALCKTIEQHHSVLSSLRLAKVIHSAFLLLFQTMLVMFWIWMNANHIQERVLMQTLSLCTN
jgi:hypothetical protein